jgi:hypothetical protein
MILSDQLDELRTNILRDSSDLTDGDVDHLWSDDTLIRYIGDGERRFARQTLLLRDSTTPAVTRVTLVANQQTYSLHPSVLGVLSAKFDADSFDLQRSGHSLILQFTPPEFLTYDPNAAYTIPPGRPIAFFTDETLVFATKGRVTLSVYPVPGVDEDGKTLYLRTIRLPITAYTVDDLERESEMPEDFALDVLEWAAYRALRNFDTDAGDSDRAKKHKDAFDEAVMLAIKETKRKMFSNMTVRYGMNGFAWTR